MTTNIPSYRHILEKFITQSNGKQIISHQIESFNQFMEVDIPEIIHMANPITSYGSPEIPLAGPRSALATATGLSTTAANALMGAAADSVAVLGKKIQHEYEVTLEFEKISIRKPTIFENNGAIHPMMPNDARLRNLTYAAPLNIDVKVTTTFIDHTRNSIRESNVRIFPNVHLGKIPVMVGSKYCLLNDQLHVHPSKLGECAEDVGGYFIVQGGERAMISMERMSENRPFVFRNGRGSAKEQEVVEIKCIGPDNDQVPKSNTVKMVYHPKNQLITMLRATVPRIKTEIPIIILFRALGILADKEICELILGDEKDPVYDPIITESILEASSICTRDQALAWLGEHTNTWSVKSQKQSNVQDILSEELFPQIGGGEMNYEKACFLAHMTRKVLWTSSKRIPTDDRDAYPNKRVDVPGFLLADLFRKTYNNRMVKDMKAALSKEIHGGSWKATGNWTEIVNINNINKIVKSTIMDVCLKSSLATGNFGSGKIGGPNKIGVSQVLNRMNYSAGISHLRRISTPIEKTGKLIAPRKQHNSQYGYVCVRGNTAILQGDGMTSREIMTMKDGDTVITADDQTLAESASAIHHYFKTTPERVIEFKTLSGRTIGCSPDHPLLMVREGKNEWVHAGDVIVGDRVIVKNYTVPLSDKVHAGEGLLHYSQEETQIIARLTGAFLDGEYKMVNEKDQKCVTEDMKPFVSFAGKMGVTFVQMFSKNGEIPTWLSSQSLSVKREFLSGFQGRYGNPIEHVDDMVYMKNTVVSDKRASYIYAICELFGELGVTATFVQPNEIQFENTYANMARYASVIGWRYATHTNEVSALAIEYAMYRLVKVNSIYPMSFKLFRDRTQQVDDKIIMPIVDIKECDVEDVYDFTTESENHDFYANGILVRNCPCETPEGHGVGVVKNMATTTMITIFSSPITVYAFIQKLEKLIFLRDTTMQQKHDHTRVFLNGSWIGIFLIQDTVYMVDQLRAAKRSGTIHLHTGIVWKNSFKELWITTEAGRVIRPIYYAPAIREIAADKTGTLLHHVHHLQDWNSILLWSTPRGEKLIEYIDAGESDGAFIAMTCEKAVEDATTTHCEIHPSTLLGTTASYIPFPDHNQSPRNAYQCLWENEEVLMANGVRKAIKDVAVGEKVLSFDPVTGAMQSASIIHQYVRNTEKKIYQLTTVSGRTIVATDNHPFITEEGWKSVGDILVSPVRKLGILPNWIFPDANMQSDDASLPVLARLLGFATGNTSMQFDTPQDEEEYAKDMQLIGAEKVETQLSIFDVSQEVSSWILTGSDNVKREFLAGFLSSVSNQLPGNSKTHGVTFMSQLHALFTHFGVEAAVVENDPHGEVGLTLSGTPDNLIRYYDTIGYRYSTARIVEGFKKIECLKSNGKLNETDMSSRGRMVFVPIESMTEHANVLIADITVDNEKHSFVTSHNIGSHNSSMGKQAMGVYALNYRERFDAMSHVLCYPEIPMVSPYMSKFYGAKSLPAGQNIVVAIMTYTGYNQEDSNMMNRASLERGRYRSIFYRTYKDEERKNQSSGEEEKFCRPDPVETKHMKNAHYEKVGDDGFVPKDTYVTPDDVLIGKVVPLRVPTGAVLPVGSKKSRDVSKMPRNNESGYVDKIYKNRNGEGYSFVKIRMRQDRIPEIGDKFSSRHGESYLAEVQFKNCASLL